ncbi:BRCA1-associated RING domain protein 1 [Apium graveolens]|uniref:BRCA1-associated RING domain protein 1 n=1 Tax=Apium graveolens TaxID=4045 RepID=UPI003D7AE8A1
MAEECQSWRLLNPWLLHLQKLALELKCPLCLELLSQPVLLPCDHIFCNCCVKTSTKFGSECPSCKSKYGDQEVRSAPFMESLVSIYRSLDATSVNTLFQAVPCDAAKKLNMSPGSVKINFVDGMKTELNQVAADGNSSSGTFFPLLAKKCSHDLLNGSAEEEKMLNENPIKSALSGGIQAKHVELTGLDASVFNAGGRVTNFQSPVKDGSVKHEASKVEEIDMNQMGQLSPACTDSLGDINDNSSDPASCRDAKRQKKSNPEDTGGVCAFCHSSEVTDETGEMIHYANGKLVVGSLKPFSNGIHVHKMCIDWTPQVYYEGDYIRNLESELARASKLKCSMCGLKGAGLGCFMKSCRRSYHVPCAIKTSDCRWDFDDFLMTCPVHKSVKFPSERSKFRKEVIHKAEPVAAPIAPKQVNFWASSLTGPKDWVLCGSALSTEEKCYLAKFASTCGATISRSWNPNVTHVIASTDANGAYTRTLKVLMAILHGRWVVTMDWIKACKEMNRPEDEEKYEAGLDNHGCWGGPKSGRLRCSQNAPTLFSGINFYFSGDFLPAYKDDLLNLVTTAGGFVIKNKEQLAALSSPVQGSSTTVVVYNVDPLQYMGKNESVLLQRLRTAEDLATEFGFRVLKHTWILESVAACKLQAYY